MALVRRFYVAGVHAAAWVGVTSCLDVWVIREHYQLGCLSAPGTGYSHPASITFAGNGDQTTIVNATTCEDSEDENEVECQPRPFRASREADEDEDVCHGARTSAGERARGFVARLFASANAVRCGACECGEARATAWAAHRKAQG